MTPLNDDTEELVKRAAAGDRSAMSQLVDRHRNRLRRMIAVHLSPRIAQRVDPSDLIQDTMAEAAVRIREYANDQAVSFYPWLRCLAFQRLAKAHRYHIAAEKRSVDREDGVGAALSDDSILQLASQLVANHSTPSERLIRREVKLRVQSALDDLRPNDRNVLVLRYLEQLSMREIAEVIDSTEEAVKKRHARALHRLQSVLADTAGGEHPLA